MEQLIVDAAKNASRHNPQNTVFDANDSHPLDDSDNKDTKHCLSTLADSFRMRKRSPRYCNDPQRQATKDAGTVAVLNVVRILTIPRPPQSPRSRQEELPRSQPVYIGGNDLHGATFDVSLFTVGDGVVDICAPPATPLSGVDFNNHTSSTNPPPLPSPPVPTSSTSGHPSINDLRG
ncbi:hypothetical protein FRB90_006297 [Tulasnella sp. 427]|nr:hypothetical protein FRB90_006297 [Tulasnella sp. 427]